MKRVLDNSPETKVYLDNLPKVYAVFHWAKWVVLELPWSKKFDKRDMPLVYHYHDFNGCCDEYLLTSIDKVSSGAFHGYYYDKASAEQARATLNGNISSFNSEL